MNHEPFWLILPLTQSITTNLEKTMKICIKFLVLAALLVLSSPWSVSAESLTIYAA